MDSLLPASEASAAVTASGKKRSRAGAIAGLWAQAVHDLRQPVQAALLLASMLDGASPKSDMKRAARGIGSALNSLYEMLDVLTLLARIEAGHQVVPLHAFQLADELQPVLQELAEITAGHGITLRVRGLEGAVCSNPKLLATAMRSLVLNAIRFGDGGEIRVGCRRGRDQLRLEVQYRGDALDAAARRHAFVQLPPRGDALAAGELGLGIALLLPLCRALGHELCCEALGGNAQRLALTLPPPVPALKPVPISR
jgi:signal transduction histidine kinase